MRVTLISDFQSCPNQLGQLETALRGLGPAPLPVTLWLREKNTRSRNLPVSAARDLCDRFGLDLGLSWEHRAVAPESATLFVPDDAGLRALALRESAPLAFSCHNPERAVALLAQHPHPIVLSPWRRSASKPSAGPILDRARCGAMARRFPGRIHLLSGMRPDDLDALMPNFAGIAIMGAFASEAEALIYRLWSL